MENMTRILLTKIVNLGYFNRWSNDEVKMEVLIATLMYWRLMGIYQKHYILLYRLDDFPNLQQTQIIPQKEDDHRGKSFNFHTWQRHHGILVMFG